jgi:hypothetical protein
MRIGASLSWATVVLWGTAGWAAAQADPGVPSAGQPPEPPTFQIPAGARVRVSSSVMPGGVIEGRVTSSTDDALGLMLPSDDSPFGGGQVVVPRGSLTSLQISMGKKGHALLGLLVGTASLAAIGAFAEVDPDDCGDDSTAFCSRAEAVGGMAFVGAGLGALVGAVIRTERWQNVSVEVLAPRSGAGRAAARRRGAALGAQVAFRF